MCDLKARGKGVRESGAFLLGSSHRSGRRTVSSYALYDDLEPGCLDSGFVQMSSIGFRAVGVEAARLRLEVVADIHTHPATAFFSGTDRDNPMVPVRGHLALVVPDYAQNSPQADDCAMFRFLGKKEWETLPTHGKASRLYVGFWS